MARDYSKNQTYYEILVYFKHATKKYTVSDKPRLDDFLKKTLENLTIISYTVTAVSKFIYVEYEKGRHSKGMDVYRKEADNALANINKSMLQLEKFRNLRNSSVTSNDSTDLPF